MTDETHPKIIVDDDWKSKVQAEKESLRKAAEPHPAPGPAESPARPTTAEPAAAMEPSSPSEPGRAGRRKAESRADQRYTLPPPSFSWIVSTFANEAMMALGQLPGHDGQRPAVMLDHAKHWIDLLGVLDEKTRGNLTREESLMLDSVLHQLRMAFIAAQSP
ncbi:MAG: DUF1844 domain-containing protein [Pirellulaceae bacterium]